jgi:hypothetical protein
LSILTDLDPTTSFIELRGQLTHRPRVKDFLGRTINISRFLKTLAVIDGDLTVLVYDDTPESLTTGPGLRKNTQQQNDGDER